jgi:dTDP-4-dehydrorhamnose 3,5-epimerase-like enzyme
MPLNAARLIEFPVIEDPRGKLTFVQTPDHIPFAVKRIYYMYDLSPGALRGFHAHKQLQTIMIAMAGGFEVTLDDGRARAAYRLDRPSFGLYVPPMMWREVGQIAAGSVCLALASDTYDEGDYIRDYQAFRGAVGPVS